MITTKHGGVWWCYHCLAFIDDEKTATFPDRPWIIDFPEHPYTAHAIPTFKDFIEKVEESVVVT